MPVPPTCSQGLGLLFSSRWIGRSSPNEGPGAWPVSTRSPTSLSTIGQDPGGHRRAPGIFPPETRDLPFPGDRRDPGKPGESG